MSSNDNSNKDSINEIHVEINDANDHLNDNDTTDDSISKQCN